MEQKLSSAAKTFTPSPIQELSHLAQRSNAINLAEGFPDFPAPSHLKHAAISAINSDFNQYRYVQGISAVFAIIDQGDEVVLFDPSYETYEGCIRMAGGIPVYVALEPPHWTLNPERFINSFTARTKAVILNSPHNPTGKVFTKDELETIAGACCRRDCIAITDEVYEHITYDNIKHISLASLPGMQERTIITSSLSKTFSVTGWRVGWAIAPALFASAIRNIHVKITDSAPAPFQEAALTALRSPPEYFEKLRREYESKRDYIAHLIEGIELPENYLFSDVEYVKELIKQAGVVAVPGCGFFHTTLSTEKLSQVGCGYQKRYIRFAFCKSSATLAAAAQKLAELSDAMGCDIGGKNA
ncbi:AMINOTRANSFERASE CLASSES I AND II FAMILY PROTEIN EXPRESSED [Salix koriyanagi]|uniref:AMINOTRANSFERASE CLASSES I AND II FAMILY PROTEIN EXPRESSED n=1 Tax=Salix koriyanagi TaxID=2511006 RepID=A0A9Q0Z6L1_9ROSI|nr:AMINOTRANSFERASE CLASSES I AND II FAMILY PROTEIN EXPRESSED [Salix koriyanagi]